MNNKIPLIIFSSLIGAFTFFLINFFFTENSFQNNYNDVSINAVPVSNSFKMTAPSNISVPNALDFNLAAEKTVNAVVHIQSEYNQNYQSDPMLDFFWGPGGSRGMRPQVATGSGVIISKDGYLSLIHI